MLREPLLARLLKFLIDKFHQPNHKGESTTVFPTYSLGKCPFCSACSSGYEAKRFPALTAGVNTQACEQVNRLLGRLKCFASFLPLDRFMILLRAFVLEHNRSINEKNMPSVHSVSHSSSSSSAAHVHLEIDHELRALPDEYCIEFNDEIV